VVRQIKGEKVGGKGSRFGHKTHNQRSDVRLDSTAASAALPGLPIIFSYHS
jgi:hypothetical protein